VPSISPTWEVTRTQPAESTFCCLQSTYDGPPKLIVFGGNGFVGTRVCEEALQTGLAVVSINRSGAPKATAAWTSDVEWVKVSNPSTPTCMSPAHALLNVPYLHSKRLHDYATAIMLIFPYAKTTSTCCALQSTPIALAAWCTALSGLSEAPVETFFNA